MLIKSPFIPHILILFFVIIIPFSLLTAQVDDDCPDFYKIIKNADTATSYQEKFEQYDLAARTGVFCTQEQYDFARKKQSEILIELDRIANEAKELAELNQKQAEENKFLAMQADSARLIAEELLLEQESILNLHRASGGYEYLLERGDSALYHKEFENALINYRSALVLSNNDSLQSRINVAINANTAYDFIQQGLIFEAKPYLEEAYTLNPNFNFINENLTIIPSLDSLISVGLRGQPIHLAKVYDGPDALYFLPRELLEAKKLDTIILYQEHLEYIPDLITELDNVKEIHLHGYELGQRIFSLLSEMDSLENVQLYNCLAISLPSQLDSTFLEKKFFFNGEYVHMEHVFDNEVTYGGDKDEYINKMENSAFLEDNINKINFYVIDNGGPINLTQASDKVLRYIKHQYDGIPEDRLINIVEKYYFRNIFSYNKWRRPSSYSQDSSLHYYSGHRHEGFIAFPDTSDTFLNGLRFWGKHKFIDQRYQLSQNEISVKLRHYNRRPGKTLWHYPLYYNKYRNLTNLLFAENPKIHKLPFDLTFFPKLKKLEVHSCKKLTVLPNSLGKLNHLEFLSLRGTPIKKFPDSIGQLTQLKELHISSTKIKALPNSFYKLNHLEFLSLSGTPIKKLPDSIGQLTQLKELHISSTKIKALPNSFYKLNQLNILGCNSDLLHKMPLDFQSMSSLSKLIIIAKKDKPIDWGAITSHQGLEKIFIRVLWKNIYYKKYLIPINRRHHFRLIRSLKKTQLNDNLTELSLGFFRINTIPKELFNLTGLRVLDISENGVSKIPSTIGQLKKLCELDLSSNRIKKLPTAIYSLDSLINLNLRNNDIRILIDSFTEKQQFKTIDLGNNKLKMLPESIGKLKQLRELSLQNNKIKELPSSFNQLENLIELDLSNNRIQYLPSKINQLTKLTSLDLSNNKIKELLFFSKNFKALEALDLSNNRLDTLPEFIFSLPNLKSISITGNKFEYTKTLEIRKRFKDLGVYCKIKTRSYFRTSFQESWQRMGKGIRKLFGR